MARNKTSVEEKYNAPFPTALRRLMEERCKTQENIANVTGKTRQTVSQYVNGISEPGYDVLVKIADSFDVSLDYLLGRTADPSRMPCAVDDLGLSPKAVDTIEQLEMLDTPNEQIQFRTAAGHALDILNCLLESPDFLKVMEDMLMCFDAYWVETRSRKLEAEDYEAEIDMREAGYTVLTGKEAARFYANEAANSLKTLMYREFPNLVDSCSKDK